MDVATWIQQLPSHMGEALRGARPLFSREGLRSLVLAGLLLLTMAATGFGLRDLIAGSETAVGPAEAALVAGLAAFAIVTMWLALAFAIEARGWGKRVLAAVVYALLVLWSIGFGFGFYWKHMASVLRAQDEISEMSTSINTMLSSAEGRLKAISDSVGRVARESEIKRVREGTHGNTCENTGSGPGEFDLFRARGVLADRVGRLSGDVDAWLAGGAAAADLERGAANATVRGEIASLQMRAQQVRETYARGAPDPEAMRRDALALSARAQQLVGRVNTILEQREDFAARFDAAAALARQGGVAGTAVCRDSNLAESLESAARRLRQIDEISVGRAVLDPQLGARATQGAFYRLWNNVFRFLSDAPPEPLGSRDFVALVAAIAVDVCIFFLTLFAARGNGSAALERLLRQPLIAPELRGRLHRLISPPNEAIRDVFDRSIVRFRDQLYLVTTADLPSSFDPIRKLQVMLLAAGEVTFVRLDETGRLDPRRRRRRLILDAIGRHLNECAGGAAPEDPAGAPAAPDPEHIFAIALRSELALALQRLFSGDNPADSQVPQQDAGEAGRETPAAAASRGSQEPRDRPE